MKKLIKLIIYVVFIRFVVSLFNENSSIKEQIDKLKEEITNLEISDLDQKIKEMVLKTKIKNPKGILFGVY